MVGCFDQKKELYGRTFAVGRKGGPQRLRRQLEHKTA